MNVFTDVAGCSNKYWYKSYFVLKKGRKYWHRTTIPIKPPAYWAVLTPSVVPSNPPIFRQISKAEFKNSAFLWAFHFIENSSSTAINPCFLLWKRSSEIQNRVSDDFFTLSGSLKKSFSWLYGWGRVVFYIRDNGDRSAGGCIKRHVRERSGGFRPVFWRAGRQFCGICSSCFPNGLNRHVLHCRTIWFAGIGAGFRGRGAWWCGSWTCWCRIARGFRRTRSRGFLSW